MTESKIKPEKEIRQNTGAILNPAACGASPTRNFLSVGFAAKGICEYIEPTGEEIPENTVPIIDLNGAGGSLNVSDTFTEGDVATAYLSAATVTDADSDPLATLSIVGSGILDGASEVLVIGGTSYPLNANKTATGTAGSTTFSIAYTTSTQTFAITNNAGGTMSLTDLQSLVRGISYENTSADPTEGDRVFSFVVNDGEDNSSAATLTIGVVAVNDAPVVDLNGAGGGINASGTFTEGDAFTSYLSSATLTDADSDPLVSLIMTAGGQWGTDGPDELIKFDTWVTDADTDLTDTLVVGSTTFELAFVAATGILTVTNSEGGTFPAADGQTLKRLFQYANSAEPPTVGDRTFSWVANDGTDNSTAAVLTVTVSAAPTNSLDLGGTSGNYAGQFIIGGTAAAVSSTSAIAGDDPTAMTITLGGFVDGNDEEVTIGATSYPAATDDTGSATAGATTFDVAFASGVFTVTKNGGGAMPKADLETLIDGITTENAAWPFTTGARTLTFSLDGGTAKVATINEYIAELPREYVDTTYSLPTGGTTWTPADSAEFQDALDNSALGDVIVLTAGTTYSGSFILPYKATGSGWIYIISSEMASLPAYGELVTPADLPNMPIIMPTSPSQPPLKTEEASHHFRLAGLAVLTDIGSNDLIRTGYGNWPTGSGVTDAADLPTDITIDRCYLQDLTFTDQMLFAIGLNGIRMAAINNWVANVKRTGDAQGILTFMGRGPYKVVGNFLEATGENYLTGGADPSITNDEHPADIEFKQNYLYKRPQWRIDNDWGVKNLFELKNSQRVEAIGNIMEHNWYDSQYGYAVLFTPRNQQDTAPDSQVTDVTFHNNIVRDTDSGFVFTGADNLHTSGQTQRIHVKNIILDDVTRRGFVNSRHMLVNTGEEGKPVKWLQIENANLIFDLDDTTGYAAAFFEPGGMTNVCDYFAIKKSFVDMGTYGFVTLPTYATNVAIDESVLIYDSDSSQYAAQISGHAAAYPNSDKADAIADVEFTDLINRDYTLEATSPWYGAGVGPDLAAMDAVLPDPIVLVQIDNVAAGIHTSTDIEVSAGEIAGPLDLFPRILLIHSHSPGITSLEMTVAGVLDGADEIVVIGGVSFPLNADKNDTTVTVESTTFEIDYVTATGVFTITNNAGGEMKKEDINDLMVDATYDNALTSVTEGERTFSVNITGSAITSPDAIATLNIAAIPLPTIKINFRSTSGYVTDGAGETYCIAGDTYPITRGGATFGWENASVIQFRDRSTGVDVRIAGDAYIDNDTRYFMIDVPAGVYDVTLSCGIRTGAFSVSAEIRDEAGNPLLSVGDTSVANGSMIDAAGTEMTAANWPANNVTAQITVPSSSPQRIRIYRKSTFGFLALNHIALTPAP